jgi:thymidylate kinase
METYRTWLHLFELLPYYSWLIDRFYLSTQLYQQTVNGKTYDFKWLDNGLKDLNFHLVLCSRTPESFQAALEKRLKVSGNPSQYRDLQKYIDEQELYRELVKQSSLPVFEVDISDNNIHRAVDKITDWMKKTGGLWSK